MIILSIFKNFWKKIFCRRWWAIRYRFHFFLLYFTIFFFNLMEGPCTHHYICIIEVFGTTVGGWTSQAPLLWRSLAPLWGGTSQAGLLWRSLAPLWGGGTSQAPLLWRSLAPHWGRGLPGTTLMEVFWHLRKTPSLKHHSYEDLRHVGHTMRPGAAMREALGAL